MSKAFTRESDETDETESFVLPPRATLPPGVKNYITSAGAQRLRAELDSLLDSLLAARSASDSGKLIDPLRDARSRQLQEIIASLVIAEPPAEKDVIRFGATVTLRREAEIETYRLVGVDETNLDHNEISWLSPLAKALLGKRAGDPLRFRAPSGLEELTVLTVTYSGAS